MSDISFTKLFSSITDSTIWDESPEICKVWITMLAMADRDGYVGASVPGLANRARVSITVVQEALKKFESPDPYSRTKEHEGRRIEETERGWRLLNHGRFRETVTEEKERERKRDWARKQREKQQAEEEAAQAESHPEPSNVDGVDVDVANVDVYVDGEALRRRLPSASVSASGSETKKEDARVPCPADLELTEAQAANLEMNVHCPRWAQKQIATSFRGKAMADPSDVRFLTVWLKCLHTATVETWNDPKRRPKQPEPEAPSPQSAQVARAAADARKQANLEKIQRELDASTKGAA